MMSRNRFSALMSMIHIVDPATENKADKLRKVREFANIIKNKCKELYHPHQNVAIDERIVKSKHRSGIRQFIKNKPVKFGLKLLVLADSLNGYTIDFNVYAGKNGNEEIHENGLGYHVVRKLMTLFFGQGYTTCTKITFIARATFFQICSTRLSIVAGLSLKIGKDFQSQ